MFSKSLIQPGYRVAEVYHGEKSDILEALAVAVGPGGKVYGVDALNPFSHYQHMLDIAAVKNVELITAEIPPMPVRDLDAVVIREFLFAVHTTRCNIDKPRVYSHLSDAIVPGGHLMIILNYFEMKDREESAAWNTHYVQKYMPGFVKVYDQGRLTAFRKEV